MTFRLDTSLYERMRTPRDYQMQEQKHSLSQRMGLQDLEQGKEKHSLSQRLGLQDEQMNSEKIQRAKIEKAVQYLGMATPKNWGSIRQRAIADGLGSEAELPLEYDEAWVNKQRQAINGSSLREKGGSTGVLIDEYMKSTGASYPDALQAVQTGFRQNMLMQDGQLQTIPGATEGLKSIKSSEAAGSAMGKEHGERAATLQSMEASLPQLESTVAQLSELGKKATYTKAGQMRDTLLRETGQPVGDAGVARAEYISLVDNQILPLLRQTFGAQFTQKEGESLKITLGDPNKSPEEKDAVLRSFIEQKKQSIGSLQREVGKAPSAPTDFLTTPSGIKYRVVQ